MTKGAKPSKKLDVDGARRGRRAEGRQGRPRSSPTTSARSTRPARCSTTPTTARSPAAFPIGVGKVIPGWDKALVGVKVGSRVRDGRCPPKDGYGTTGNPQAGIKGTDSLVFVVDVIASYARSPAPAQGHRRSPTCPTDLPTVAGDAGRRAHDHGPEPAPRRRRAPVVDRPGHGHRPGRGQGSTSLIVAVHRRQLGPARRSAARQGRAGRAPSGPQGVPRRPPAEPVRPARRHPGRQPRAADRCPPQQRRRRQPRTASPCVIDVLGRARHREARSSAT